MSLDPRGNLDFECVARGFRFRARKRPASVYDSPSTAVASRPVKNADICTDLVVFVACLWIGHMAVTILSCQQVDSCGDRARAIACQTC